MPWTLAGALANPRKLGIAGLVLPARNFIGTEVRTQLSAVALAEPGSTVLSGTVATISAGETLRGQLPGGLVTSLPANSDGEVA